MIGFSFFANRCSCLPAIVFIWMSWWSVHAQVIDGVQKHEAIYYLIDSESGTLARYDLENATWLSSLSVNSGTEDHVFTVDSDGLYVGAGSAIYRYNHDGSGKRLVTNVESRIISLFCDGNLLLANRSAGLYARVTTVDKGTSSVIASRQIYIDSLHGASLAAGANKILGRSAGVSPSDITFMKYGDDGTLISGGGSPYHGDYPSASETWVFPDDSRVVDDSGTIYSVEDLRYLGSFAGGITDLTFAGDDIPILLRGQEVIAFSNTLLETGRATLTREASHLVYHDGRIFAFQGMGPGEEVEIVTSSSLALAEPGAPKSAIGLSFTPDDFVVGGDGTIGLLSGTHQSIFRWSPGERQYLATLPLLGAPDSVTFHASGNELLTGYANGELKKIDLDSSAPVEVPFANLPGQANAVLAVGENIMAVSRSGSRASYFMFRSDGQLIQEFQGRRFSNFYQWNEATGKAFHLRDGTSPNDLLWTEIDENGMVGQTKDSPYHGDYVFSHPIRVNEEGSRVVIGSGVVFDATSLEYQGALPFAIDDGVWTGTDELIALREINGLTQLQRFSGANLLPGTAAQLNGTPLRLLQTSEGLVVITQIEGKPRFAIIDPDTFEVLYLAPSKPVAPSDSLVVGKTDQSVTVSWSDESDNENGFEVQFRPFGQGDWIVAGRTAELRFEVTGLQKDRNYQFRVLAFNEEFISDPSPPVAARTLSDPDAPVGEPYFLAATRIFHDSITLEWRDNADNETAFLVYRLTSPGQNLASAFRREVPAGTTVITDDNLTHNRQYYYHVQAVNGDLAGDLSAQLEVRTLTADSVPSIEADQFEITGLTAERVGLSWRDNSSNESGFIILRSENPGFSPRVEIARVGYNVTSYLDTTVEAGRTYHYRIEAFNGVGVNNSFQRVTAQIPRLGGDFAGAAHRHGEIYYFSFTGPDRIERYDMANRTWLNPVPLASSPTALWVDEDGIFVGLDRQLVRVDESGLATPLTSSVGSITGLFAVNGDFLVATGQSSDGLSLRKSDGILVENFDIRYRGQGFSILPGRDRVFARSSGRSPSDILMMRFDAAGRLVEDTESPYHGDYPSADRAVVFPNGALVADTSGTVYNTADLTYNGSLAGEFIDMDFIGNDLPVVLRQDSLSAFTNTLLTTGSVDLDGEGLRIAVADDSVLVFYEDGNRTNGLRVEVIALDDLNATEPGEPKDPNGLTFIPDDAFIDREGIVHLFSKSHLSLFRWSTVEKKYLRTLPLIGTPTHVAYSAETHRVFTAYPSGEIKMIDLSAGEDAIEVPFVNSPRSPHGLATAGGFLLVADPSGAWNTHYTYSPEGNLISAVDWNRRSREYWWDPVKRRMYFFRDGTSPNDIHYEEIGSDGTIGGVGESPYHGRYTMVPPIRVKPDGSLLVMGSGRLYDTEDLSTTRTLDRELNDAVWLDEWMFTASEGPEETTQLIKWNEEFSGVSTILLDGLPQRLFTLPGDRIVAVNTVDGLPTMTIFDGDLEVEFGSATKVAPTIVVPPVSTRSDWGGNARLEVGVIGSTPLTYQWFKDGQPLPDSNSRILEIPETRFTDAGSYRVEISNSTGEVTSPEVELHVGRTREGGFTPGSLLVSTEEVLKEYTPNGELLASTPIPHPDNNRHDAADVIVDRFGRALIFNNAPFDNSYVSVLDPVSGSWDHWTDPTMSLGVTTNGDISILNDGVYTNRSRFELLSGERRSFVSYDEVSAGLDGQLLGLSGSRVSSLDPVTGEVLTFWDLGGDLRGVTTDREGRIFVATWSGEIARYSRNGIADGSVNFSGSLFDLDLSSEGRLAAGSRFGEVFLTDSELTVSSRFSAGSRNTYVAWVPHFVGFDTEPDESPVAEDTPFSYLVQFFHSDPAAVLTIDGNWPDWMILTDHGDGSATLAGIPTTDLEAGIHPVMLRATGDDGLEASQSFELNVIAVNDAPVSPVSSPVAVDEDAGEQRINLADIFSDEEDIALDYQIEESNDPDSLLALLTITEGGLVFRSKPDVFGAVTVTVKGSDSGGLSTRTDIQIVIRPVDDAPVAAAIPDVVAAAEGTAAELALASFFSDADPGDFLRFEIVGNDNPDLFAGLTIDSQTGVLNLIYAPYVSGDSIITIRATDSSGLEVQAEVKVTLPEIAQPKFSLTSDRVLNRRTGLIEQTLTVTNVGARAIGGFALTISDLPDGATVYNSSVEIPNTGWLVHYNTPVAVAQAIEITLEYYSPTRQIPDEPLIEVEHRLPVPENPHPGDGALTIDRMMPMPGGAMAIEFPTIPGECYLVQYSGDGQTWHDSFVRLRAGGTRTQWLDQGAPKTPRPPGDDERRFYRVIKKP